MSDYELVPEKEVVELVMNTVGDADPDRYTAVLAGMLTVADILSANGILFAKPVEIVDAEALIEAWHRKLNPTE